MGSVPVSYTHLLLGEIVWALNEAVSHVFRRIGGEGDGAGGKLIRRGDGEAGVGGVDLQRVGALGGQDVGKASVAHLHGQCPLGLGHVEPDVVCVTHVRDLAPNGDVPLRCV